MKTALLFINPRSRRGREQISFVQEWLGNNNIEILNSNPQCHEDEIHKCIIQQDDQFDLVIIGGGDGSLHTALPALLKTNKPVLYLPIGTLNVLAKNLNLPQDIQASLELIHSHTIYEMDVGLANDIPFHSIVGLGLSTQVNRLVRSDLKRWIGPLAFAWTGLKVIYRMSPFRIWLKTDHEIHFGRSWQVTICNGKYYGSGFEIAPSARLDDRIFHGVSVETKKWWHIFKLIFPLLTNSLGESADLKSFRSGRMELKTKGRMRVDLDGDVKTRTPLTLSIHPQKLKILIPKKS